MKKILILIFVLLISCGSGPRELFETAELELLQRNYPHATSLYQEIINKYPKSELAAKSRIRLEEIRRIVEEKNRK
ncbi:MAG: hypothetical protein KQH63_13520 [Desulfobulbaceae bacterium]|nr:hypothetical protein [Desulfobulbaceae bacterium]